MKELLFLTGYSFNDFFKDLADYIAPMVHEEGFQGYYYSKPIAYEEIITKYCL